MGLGVPAAAHADQFTVTKVNDSNDPNFSAGTLREAVREANAHAGPDTIVFDSTLTGSVWIQFGEIQITDGLTIQGPGSRRLSLLVLNKASRIFNIDPTVPGSEVTISGLELDGGYATSSGGAILNQDAKLTIRGSWIAGNQSAGDGGALSDAGAYGAQTRIEDSTFSGNSALNGSGGAIASESQLGTIVNSTLVTNYAHDDGGAVSASDDGGAFQNVTIAFNRANGDGGGIAAEAGGPNLSLDNSIVANNAAGSGAGHDVSDAEPIEAEFSSIRETSGLTIDNPSGSNMPNVDPEFFRSGTLTYDQPGPPTMKLGPESPLIDQGKAAGGVTSDERGEERPFDVQGVPNSTATGADGSDMGAVELNTVETTPEDLALSIADSPDPATEGDPLNYGFTVENNGTNLATGVSIRGLLPPEVSVSSVSGNCFVGFADYYGTHIYCDLGNVASGASRTGSLTVTPEADALSVPYISAYGMTYSEQTDPNTYDNYAYADTVVAARPPTPVAPVSPPVSARHKRKKCKKKHRAAASKKKKCKKHKKKRRTRARHLLEAQAPEGDGGTWARAGYNPFRVP